MNTPKAAIVLAAGKGTRMKSARPKVLFPALGKPLVVHSVERAVELGCDPIVVVIGHRAQEVREALEARFPKAPLRFVEQKEQLGTAHAVECARKALSGFGGRVLVLYGDVPLLTRDTLRKLARASASVPLGFLSMRLEDPTGYGRVVRDEDGVVVRIVEQKDASAKERAIDECNGGIYDIDARFLFRALRAIGKDNAQGEYYLTDLIEAAHRAGTPAVAVEVPAEEVSGVNDRAELARAEAVLRERKNRALMEAGVTLVDPGTAWIEEDVRIEADVVIEPNVRITGRSRIGAGSVIGFGSVIENSVIGRDVQVKPYCVVEESRIEDRVALGPFARLRPHSELGEGVRIGNFVETKNARFEKGAKANHLSYVGDAHVGENTNIGAGTITCNYDGKNKNKTVLGRDVFIGSDTQLVAPVRVGDGAYVGAGTTVVRDVPPGALALSRPQQIVKEGWVAKRKAKLVAKPKVAARRRSK